VTVKTTAGPVGLARRKLRGTSEAFASRLFGSHVTKTNALESLVIASFAGQARSRSGGGRPRPGRGPLEQEGTTAGQLPGRPGRLLISCLRAAGQELKFAIAGAQPTP